VPDQVVPEPTLGFQCLVKVLKGTGEAGKAGKTVVNVMVVNSDESDKPAEEVAKLVDFGGVDKVAEDAVAADIDMLLRDSHDPVRIGDWKLDTVKV